MTWIIILISLAILVITVFLLLRISQQTVNQLNNVTQQINERLREMSLVLRETQSGMGERLDSASSVFGDVRNRLGELSVVSKDLLEVGKNISSLQDLLRPPKVRGEIGETMLGNILMQVFGEHKQFYSFQHQFKSGQTVDAVIRIGKNLVPIDAKFPMESFQRLLNSNTEEEKKLNRRDFINSIKKKVDEVCLKYILPDEGTFDFALMYIPAESVYYEIIKDEQICSFALSKKVIPVSPNTFYPYLQVISQGLKGLTVERHAREILANLSRLQADLARFKEDFEVLGRHINNARQKFDEADRKLVRFSEKLLGVEATKQIEGGEK